jgi:arylsulfatase A-like enzyme
VTTAALVPTVLDVLGIPPAPGELDETSLAPWWREPLGARPEPHFATGTYYFGEKHAVVFDGWKLVVELDTGRVELFDLAADPRELDSLASAHPDVRERGLALVAAWEARCDALRARLGIAPAENALAGETLRVLRSLGYDGAQ